MENYRASAIHYPEYAASPELFYPSFGYQGCAQTSTPMFSEIELESASASPIDLHYLSIDDSPTPDDISISISTAFHPTAYAHLPQADTIFSSSEGVLFYVHLRTILNTCASAFQHFLGNALDVPEFRGKIIVLDCPSEELNVILHMLYGTSPAAHSPSFETLERAVDSMSQYSIPPDKYIVPSTPLFDLLLLHAPLRPLEMYTLAAHHGLHSLAVTTSSYLVAYLLSTITDTQALRMGAKYMKGLMVLQVVRLNALKAILLPPPPPHPLTKRCGFSDQGKLTRAWALAIAYLAWEAQPDISTHSMRAIFVPLKEHLDCKDCQRALQDRVNEVITSWSLVAVSAKYPIPPFPILFLLD